VSNGTENGNGSSLGESLRSVEKFDTPIEQATTPSLDAFKAYTLGLKAMDAKGTMAAIPFFHRAVELDPNFALAYSWLGNVYGETLLEPGLAAESMRKAYQLRDRVSERERLAIRAAYHANVTGDLEKAIQAYELWSQTYPQDSSAHNGLALMYEYSGQYEKSAAETLEAIRLFPDTAINYSNLMEDYAALNRLNEAKVVCRRALERKLDNVFLHDDLYSIAFLQGDPRR
jgi:eukaryotic-like serine/threonine-protein kinase